jgi:Uma2 family endonuclease
MASSTSTKFWTYEDLFALPDDGKRYEIIHGELYEMPSPNFSHGTGIVNLIGILLPIVRSLGGILRTAPMDVFIKNGNPVQPNILVLLRDRLQLISSRGIEGAPNLLIEILSPSNSIHDHILKRDLYAQAGVLEYWLVSPEAGIVEVLTLAGQEYRTHVRAGANELVTSRLLPELSFSASDVFTT